MARFFDLNPQQQAAVKCTEGSLLVLAGAGTGKTRVITMRIAYLLHQGATPDSVLAVTFTNKAANEMRARVAQLVDKAEAKKITVCTFHSLCVRILRQDIERLGYKTNFVIYDEGDQLGLIRKIIARISAKNEKLDPNQAKNLISKAKNINPWSGLAREADGKAGEATTPHLLPFQYPQPRGREVQFKHWHSTPILQNSFTPRC
jgi:DNA helicase II / ATP-dependent DNA helicase PcrA